MMIYHYNIEAVAICIEYHRDLCCYTYLPSVAIKTLPFSLQIHASHNNVIEKRRKEDAQGSIID